MNQRSLQSKEHRDRRFLKAAPAGGHNEHTSINRSPKNTPLDAGAKPAAPVYTAGGRELKMDDRSDQSINDQLFQILNNSMFTSEFISGIAGDSPLTAEDERLYERLREETGDDLYVKILFYITHQVFLKDDSKKLWNDILTHKYELSRILNRNVEITVATLDYLTHIKNSIKHPKLVGEAFIGKIAELSSSDGLTKLYNRSYLFIKIKEEINRYNRYQTPFSFIILDIDDFKKVNDCFGHSRGDEILTRLGALLSKSKRDLDVCARYGGEEFAIILPYTKSREAVKISERIRKLVEAYFTSDCGVTISLGVSNCPKSAVVIERLVTLADEALYESKRAGKNRVTLH